MESIITRNKPWSWLIYVVVLLSTLLLFVNLGKHAFWDYDEGIYAQVIKDTESMGETLSFKRLNVNWFEKPPLYFWASMLSEKVFHGKEFAYRFPAAATGVVSIILVMFLVYYLTANYFATFVAGLVLLTSPPYIQAARQLRLDVPVSAAIIFSIYSFIRGKKDPRWYVGLGVGIGIGVLTKSVIGLFPLIFILIWTVLNRDVSWIKNKFMWFGVLAFFVVVLPWHIYESLRYGMEFWNSYLFYHVVDRFQENILSASKQTPNSLYFDFLLFFAQPWITIYVLFLPVILYLKRIGKNINDILCFALFVLALVSLFLIAKTKIDYYLTPIYPFIAVFIALTTVSVLELIDLRKYKYLLGLVATAVALIAVLNTLHVSSNNVYLYKINQIVSDDERNAGLIVKNDPENNPVFTYNYEYWDTLGYYSNQPISQIQEDQIITKPFYVVVHTESGYSFPDELMQKMKKVYSGQSLTMYKFIP